MSEMYSRFTCQSNILQLGLEPVVYSVSHHMYVGTYVHTYTLTEPADCVYSYVAVRLQFDMGIF